MTSNSCESGVKSSPISKAQGSVIKLARKSVLIISFSWLEKDPRVLRQIDALVAHMDVSTVGYGPKPDSRVFNHSQLTGTSKKFGHQRARATMARRLARATLTVLRAYRLSIILGIPGAMKVLSILRKQTFDLVLANEVETLPLVLAGKQSDKLLLDLHEYAPGHLEPGSLAFFFYSPLKEWLCIRYLPEVPVATVVNESIGNLYQQKYGLRKFFVVRNIPLIQNLAPSTTGNTFDIVYHGLYSSSRGIPELIESLSHLPNFAAHFFIEGDGGPQILESASRYGVYPRVFLHDPVPVAEISRAINRFDLALVFIKPSCENHHLALPNKLFESIGASLAVISGPSPNIADVLRKYKNGRVTAGFGVSDLVETLGSLNHEEVDYFKHQSSRAHEELNWERERENLFRAVETIVSIN